MLDEIEIILEALGSIGVKYSEGGKFEKLADFFEGIVFAEDTHLDGFFFWSSVLIDKDLDSGGRYCARSDLGAVLALFDIEQHRSY